MNNTTQPTDTEMLDWMIKNELSIAKICDVFCVYDAEIDECMQPFHKTPRQAIATEMMKEATK